LSRQETANLIPHVYPAYSNDEVMRVQEAALLAGLKSASGDAVVTIDSDLQHPPALIPRMIEEWRNGAAVSKPAPTIR